MPKQPSAYPECRHILSNGRKCHSPALTGKPFCFQHARHRNYTGRNQRSIDSVELPPLEDHSSTLLAINQVVFSLTHGRITDKMASRLLYAIQLAQNAIKRLETPAPEELVTDYLDGHYGDIVAPAEPGAAPGDDDPPLLSDHAKTNSGHGDTCWEPTNADYEPEPAVETTQSEPTSKRPEPVESPIAQPSTAHPACEPTSSPVEPDTPGPAGKFGPGGTVDNSPGRKSRVANAISEVPGGTAEPRPPKPGPWDNPLLDHIVHQLQSGISEREIAAQLTRDLQANKFALSS